MKRNIDSLWSPEKTSGDNDVIENAPSWSVYPACRSNRWGRRLIGVVMAGYPFSVFT
jgi:hypothetical protein